MIPMISDILFTYYRIYYGGCEIVFSYTILVILTQTAFKRGKLDTFIISTYMTSIRIITHIISLISAYLVDLPQMASLVTWYMLI